MTILTWLCVAVFLYLVADVVVGSILEQRRRMREAGKDPAPFSTPRTSEPEDDPRDVTRD